jgi:hypothetical protein
VEYKKGDRVKLIPKPEYGTGYVLMDNQGKNVSIFFVNVGTKKFSADSNLKILSGEEAKHPILDNLYFDKSGNVTKRYKNFEAMISEFLSLFSEGFETPKYKEEERNYKIEASKFLHEILGKLALSELIAKGDFEEVSKRAFRIISKTNLVFPNESMALKDGLSDPEKLKTFALSLNDLLYSEVELKLRVESFIELLEQIGAAKWTILTYFLFIGFPDRFLFLKPIASKQATEVFAFDIKYKPELNWNTFKAHQDFGDYLYSELYKQGSPIRPKDMIDVQGFIYCVSKLYKKK